MHRTPCICIFASLYLPSIGGVEAYTANLAKALVRKGYRVIVVTCNIAELASKQIENGIEIVRLPCLQPLRTRYPIPRGNSEVRELWSHLRRQAIDYIVVNTRFYPLSLSALAFSRDIGIVPILIEHGSAHLTLGNRFLDVFVRQVEHHLTSKCKRYPVDFYAVSEKASAWLRHFGITSKGELSNSIDAREFAESSSGRDYRAELGLPENSFLVSFVGRLVPEKGVIPLLNALKMLDRDDFVVAFAGKGPLESSVQNLGKKNCIVLGRLSRPDVAALLKQTDLLCLPSRSEGFATVLLEAAACGTPVMTTDVGGVKELIPDPSFGTILPDASPSTIAKALDEAIEGRKALPLQGAKCRELVTESYSWSRTAEKTIKACEAAQGKR
ncbi:MAG TPA: glycosyltransferase family 4 protein [Candidatus Aphodovivens avistercoris]|nr:glycosyltransferase family 4 protein [Candidatus Aphodovivens avistercoris]